MKIRREESRGEGKNRVRKEERGGISMLHLIQVTVAFISASQEEKRKEEGRDMKMERTYTNGRGK